MDDEYDNEQDAYSQGYHAGRTGVADPEYWAEISDDDVEWKRGYDDALEDMRERRKANESRTQ
ncbi:hypothetical protein GCM10023116_12880 [Kistimonas scapharcae]|uniref:Uncharacterized protein n=2 Tax=Kistimonas scapharcae TaxID=1036133 RepID=A0ABP8UZ35_9GAMM